MFNRVLIANRGEIAVRIVRACREAGLVSIAAYSDADRDSLHVHLADERICIGPAAPSESYLNVPRLLGAAHARRAEAVHPGYGFLAEDAGFARACRECGLIFIGPSTESLARSGDKAVCRALVREAGVPVLPGSEGRVAGLAAAQAVAGEVGYPLLVKAAAGGGGRGVRVARTADDLARAVASASKEAQAVFGDGGVYLERYVAVARHVEVQILADEQGHAVALGERECSLQRRRQKLIEETPSPAVDVALRGRLEQAGLDAALALGHTNAGTAEFLLTPDGQFHFIEFNARIQVEHAITEAVRGMDLIGEQLRLAGGEVLDTNAPAAAGHAIEARVYAEDPARGFAPCPGTVTDCRIPGGPGIRVDTHLCPGCRVPHEYDPLLAKVIAWGRTREQAAARLAGALTEFSITGVTTTAPYCAQVVGTDWFLRGNYAVGTVEAEKF